MDDKFVECCESGDLIRAKEICSHYDTDFMSKKQIRKMTRVFQNAFTECCIGDHIDVVKYLLTLKCPIINLGFNKNIALRNACKHGSIRVVKYLLTCDRKNEIDTHVCEDYIYRSSFKNGYIEILKNLIDFEPFNSDIFYEKVVHDITIDICDPVNQLIQDGHYIEAIREIGITDYKFGDNIENDSKFRDRLDKCVICLDDDVKTYVITPCLHGYCPECFITAFYNDAHQCTYCRTNFQINDSKIYDK